MITLSTSGVSRSRMTLSVVVRSRYRGAGPEVDCDRRSSSRHDSQSLLKSLVSTRWSFDSATVRTMMPNPPGLNDSTTLRSRRTSYLSVIFREMPIKSAFCTSTSRRPGMAMSVVTRGPLPANGSLITCTRISCPDFRSGVLVGGPLRRLPDRAGRGVLFLIPSSSERVT